MFSKYNVDFIPRFETVQNLSAVTGACLMTKRAVWVELGGLDEKFQISLNDIDFCMRIREKGGAIVFTPYAVLYHHESKSRGADDNEEKIQWARRELESFSTRYVHVMENVDPFYSFNLTLD
jgi:GT2 family glycosyltransferase